jgi:hypothetical protein
METLETSDQRRELVFRSTPLKEEFGTAGMVILFLFLLVQCVLLGAGFVISGRPEIIIGSLVLVGLLIGSVAAVLLLFRGKVVLEEKGLVEYNGLNAARRFSYAQIIDFSNGAYANSLVIRYFPRTEDGEIDTRQIKKASLIAVQNLVALKFALARRITARPPDPATLKRPNAEFVFFILLLPLLLILALVLLWMNR